MLHIALAYAIEDQALAQQIDQDLTGYVQFEHFGVAPGSAEALLASMLDGHPGPAMLLLTDNFLRNENCMYGAESFLLERDNVEIINAETRRYDEELQEIITVNPDLSDPQNRADYDTYWYNRALALPQKSSFDEDAQHSAQARSVARIGSIRDRIAGLLLDLSEAVTFDLADVEEDSYALFFSRFSSMELHRKFVLERHAFLSSIPGLQMVHPDTAEAEQLAGTEEHGLGADAGAGEVGEEQSPKANLDKFELPSLDLEEDLNDNDAGSDQVKRLDVNDQIEADAQAEKWIKRAWQLYEEGHAEGGLELLAGGKETLPDHPDIAYNYALMLAMDMEVPEVALLEIHKLLDEFHDHAPALFLSGELSLLNGDYDGANLDWLQLIEVDPLYPDLNYRLGSLISEHFPARAAEALTYLRRAARDEPANGDARYRYAMLLHGHYGKEKKAIKWLKRAVDASPDHAAAHYALATLLLARGKKTAARNYYRTATDLDPSYATETNEVVFGKQKAPGTASATADNTDLSALRKRVIELEQQLADGTAAKKSTFGANNESADGHKPGTGQIVFISGATSGIGKATAYALAGEGYDLILLGRREKRLEELRKEFVANFGIECLTIAADVRQRAALQSAIKNLPEKWRNIDVLINNAGKAKGFDPVHEGDYAHWDEMIDVNLKGLLTLTREISPLMVARETGTIINVCSTAGKEVYPNGNVYCASKHAVDALTYAMRLDLVKYGIRVGQICPAHVEETEFAVVRFDGDEERARIYEGFQPLRSRDVAEAVRFMVTAPAHVNIMDLVLQGTQQASSTVVNRSGREKFAPRD